MNPPPATPRALLEHASFVRGVARSILRREDLVDDVVQATWTAAIEGEDRRRGPLRPWLGGVVRRQAWTLLRRRGARRRREERAARSERQPAVDELAARAEIGRRLVEAVLALDEPYRTVVLLRYYDDVPQREIARRLGVSRETVHTRLRRARERLRAALEAGRDDPQRDWRVGLALLAWPRGVPAFASSTGILGGALVASKTWIVALACLLLLVGFFVVDPFGRTGDRAADPATDAAVRAGASADGGDAATLAGRRGADAPRADLPPPVAWDAVDRGRDLHGVVVDEAGTGIAGARLVAVRYPWRDRGLAVSRVRFREHEDGPETQTAVDGTFRLPLEVGDLVYLRVEATGFAPLLLTRLQAGERTRIVLRPGVSLTVRVVAPDGKPASGVTVSVQAVPQRAPGWFEAEAESGRDGRAHFPDLAPGAPVTMSADTMHEGWASVPAVPYVLPERGAASVDLALPAGVVVSGRVLAARTDLSVPGARVSRTWNFQDAVRTDARGRFRLGGLLPARRDALHVAAEGFASRVVPVTGTGAVEIRLESEVQVAGRVVDADGRAIGGARVSVVGRPPSDRNDALYHGTATTAADGVFAVGGLGHGAPYLVRVEARGYGRLLLDVDPPTGTSRSDLGDLRLPAPCTVAGRVLGSGGEPVARVPVRLDGGNPDRMRLRGDGAAPAGGGYADHDVRATDDLGRFCFPDLAPGVYRVSARPEAGEASVAEVEVSRETPSAEATLRVDPIRDVRFRVVDERGDGIEGLAVAVDADWRVLGRAVTDASGEAVLPLPVRALRLTLSGAADVPFRLPLRRDLGADEDVLTITLVRLATIAGRLVDPDGAPLASALVGAACDDGTTDVVTTDADGRFAARVPPRTRARLTFHGRFWNNRMPQRPILRPLVAEADAVPAGTTGVKLTAHAVPTDGVLTVRVLDPDGRPLAGAAVKLTPLAFAGLAGQATGADGRARFEGVMAIPVVPVVTWAATPDAPWIGVHGDETVATGREVVLRLARGALLAGVVRVEATGEPAAGAYVYVRDGTDGPAAATADEAGRFFVAVDPDLPGPFALAASFRDAEGRRLEGVREGVAPAASNVVLRLAPRD